MIKKIITSPFFLFPLISCLVFWPLSFQIFTLKNDALTYYYPLRTLISDALNNGELPLWTPFINMGYPLHADMQSGAWNPVIWSFSFLTNYSLAAFHYELLFYISFAGIGFYFLCKEFGCSKAVAFSFAIAYQFCGFITDSVQFFNCISAACYLPYIFIFFRRILISREQKDALVLALFLFLLFTGGYPSFFIITSYILLAYFIFHFLKEKNKQEFIKQFLPVAVTAIFSFLLLSLPAIISFVQHLPFIERGKSQSLVTVLENSMNPSTCLSLLSPFAITANDNWLHSSILMRSIYMGITPLIFFVYSFFKKGFFKNKEMLFFLVCSLCMLGLAWGEFFFLRQLAYFSLPLMDSFRHPALFRLFSIFFFLIIAAVSFNSWNKENNIRILKNIILVLLAITFAIALASIIFSTEFSFKTIAGNAGLKNILSSLHFTERYFIQLPLLITFLLLNYWAIVKKKTAHFIGIVLVADMFFATQLNMPVTVFGSKHFAEVENLINRNSIKFPLPDTSSIEENSANSFDENLVTGSKIPFTKKIGRNDYFISPGNLSKQDKFYESPIKDIVFKNPAVYFPDSLVLLNEKQPILNNKIAYTEDSLCLTIKTKPSQEDNIKIQQFAANNIFVNVYKETAGYLVYQQNFYPGWKAYVDGMETKIIPVNISFMEIQIPSGKHSIIFCYKPRIIVYAWYVSLISLTVLLIIYSFIVFSKSQSEKRQKEIL